MKSRRELVSGLFVDLSRAIIITLVIGKFASPDLIPWTSAIISMVFAIASLAIAWFVHPNTDLDKEWKLWK